MAHQSRFAGYAGLVAAASLAFTPAQAQAADVAPQGTFGYATSFLAQAGTPGVQNPVGPSAGESVDNVTEYRRWRRGWRRGWRGRRGIRGGDILAGVLVLGGIAAIASAASNNNRRRDRDVVVVERDRVRDDDRRYDYRPERRSTNRSTNSGSGIDNAVSMCLNTIEQDVRVDSVDGATRVAEGWLVTGTLFNGSNFNCEIDNAGRISRVDYGGFSSIGDRQDNQWSDERYSNARAEVGFEDYERTNTGTQVAAADGQQPAYPGGPLPGEDFPE